MGNIATTPTSNTLDDKRESDSRLIEELVQEDVYFRIFCAIESATTAYNHRNN